MARIRVEMTKKAYIDGIRYRPGQYALMDEDRIAPSMIPVDKNGRRIVKGPEEASIVEQVMKDNQRRAGKGRRARSVDGVVGQTEADEQQAAAEKPETESVAVPEESKGDRAHKLLLAVAQLDHSNDEHWTKSGLPRIDVIEALSGIDTTREELSECAVDVERRQSS